MKIVLLIWLASEEPASVPVRPSVVVPMPFVNLKSMLLGVGVVWALSKDQMEIAYLNAMTTSVVKELCVLSQIQGLRASVLLDSTEIPSLAVYA